MKIKLFVKIGLLVLVTGVLLEVGSSVKAGQPDWVRTERVQFLRAVGTIPLGSRSHYAKMPAVKVEQENAVQASQRQSTNQTWLDIYKSLSFLGGA
jgi:hypothetical protein